MIKPDQGKLLIKLAKESLSSCVSLKDGLNPDTVHALQEGMKENGTDRSYDNKYQGL